MQSWASPALDRFFFAVTMLGDEKFYLVLLSLLYWNVSPRCGYRMTVLFLVSILLNGGLKDWFDTVRPFEAVPDQVRLVAGARDTALGGAFPSGHAQGTTTVWGGLWLMLRKPWLLGLAVVVVLLVSLSRLYLGVHWPQDVLGGIAFGVGVTGLAALVWRYGEPYLSAVNGWVRWGAAVLVPLALYTLAHASSDAPKVAGALLGLNLGHLLAASRLEKSPARSPAQKLCASLVALIGLVALYLGLAWCFPDLEHFRFLRYALIGFWVPAAAWLLSARPPSGTAEKFVLLPAVLLVLIRTFWPQTALMGNRLNTALAWLVGGLLGTVGLVILARVKA